MRYQKRFIPARAVSGLGLVAVACAVSIGTATATASTSKASKSAAPILIGGSVSLSNPTFSAPELRAGLLAAIDGINAKGGINGHKLKLDFCDGNYNVNQELQCARTLVKDKVEAVIDPVFLADTSGAEFKLFQAAGIAVIGDGSQLAETTNPDVYDLGGGFPAMEDGAIAQLLKEHATKISVLEMAQPLSEYFGALAVAGLKAAGLKPVSIVQADPTSDPTFATAAAKVTAGGVNGILSLPSPADQALATKALQNIGYKGHIGAIATSYPPPVIAAMGKAGNGQFIASEDSFTGDTANPAVAAYRANMKKYEPSAVLDFNSITPWTGVQLFAKVIGGLKKVDTATIAKAFASVKRPVNVGSIGPWKSVGVRPPFAADPRILDPNVTVGVLENGTIKSLGGFFNPLTVLAKYKKQHK